VVPNWRHRHDDASTIRKRTAPVAGAGVISWYAMISGTGVEHAYNVGFNNAGRIGIDCFTK
jgi:hypothetical protein